MVSLVQFHPDPRESRLFTSAVDCTVCVWNLETSRYTVYRSGLYLV